MSNFIKQINNILSRNLLLIACLCFFASLFFYNWDLLFTDSVCYLKNVIDVHNFYMHSDRLIHLSFMHYFVKLFDQSPLSFLILRNSYRLIMLIAVFVWWLVFKQFVDTKEQKHWLAFFMVSMPVFLYVANQILPEQFSLLFSALTILFFLKGINKNSLLLQLASGFMMYLTFFSRNDGLLVIPGIFLSLLIFAYKPRKQLLLHMSISFLSFLLLSILHKLLLKIPITEISPLFFHMIIKTSWSYPVLWGIKYQVIKAVGFGSIFALFSINSLKNKNVKIIFLATILVYIPILLLVFTGYSMAERHTMQGALFVPFLMTIGFLNFIDFTTKRLRIPFVIIVLVLLGIIFTNIIICANHMTGGFNVKKGYQAIDIIEKKYPTDKILLVADYPSYFFYYFVYPDKKWIYVSYGGWQPDQRMDMVKWGKEAFGNQYISTYEEVKSKNPKYITYLGFMHWSAFNDDKRITFNEIDKNLSLWELKFK